MIYTYHSISESKLSEQSQRGWGEWGRGCLSSMDRLPPVSPALTAEWHIQQSKLYYTYTLSELNYKL